MRELPPFRRQLVTRFLFGAHAVLQGFGISFGGVAAPGGEIQPRHVSGDRVRSRRRFGHDEIRNRRAFHADRDQRIVGRIMPAARCAPFARIGGGRSPRTTMGVQQDLIGAALHQALGAAACAHDAQMRTGRGGRRRALRPRRTLRPRRSLRAGSPRRSGNAAGPAGPVSPRAPGGPAGPASPFDGAGAWPQPATRASKSTAVRTPYGFLLVHTTFVKRMGAVSKNEASTGRHEKRMA